MNRNNENINDFIPYKLEDINCDIPYDISNLDSAIISKLRLMTAEDLQNISEVTEGIENRILSSANMSYSFENPCRKREKQAIHHKQNQTYDNLGFDRLYKGYILPYATVYPYSRYE